MAFSSTRKTPLYFFYDCETTDSDVKVDKLIEIAAVIHLATLKPGARRELKRSDSHEFSSLCFCDRELGKIPQQLIGLTKDDLKNEPPLEEVLKRFFDWIEASIATANELDKEDYIPVLVSHSGSMLDFPMLLKEVDCSPSLTCQLKRLNFRYVDTFYVFKDLKRSKPAYRFKLESLSLKNIYKAYFHFPYEGHRALADARALCKIFSEASPAEDIEIFKKHTQDQVEMVALEQHIQKFRNASINSSKALDILAKGIKFDTLVTEYQRSSATFQTYLRTACGIRNPRPEVIQYFRTKY